MSLLYSLFPGRWQPFHDGHKEICEQILAEGRNLCIAIRDTPINEKNPFTVEERIKAIQEYNSQIKIVTIPDIDQILVGRNLGYEVRYMDNKTVFTSGTKERGKL